MDEAPNAIEEERNVLGSIMLNKSVLGTCMIDVGLRPEHFYLDRHAAIYRAALQINSRGDEVSSITVWRELEGSPPDGVDRHYLSELESMVAAPLYAATQARQIVETAGLRAKVAGARQILEGVAKRDHEMIGDGLQRASADLEADAQPSTPEEIGSWMFDWLEAGHDPADVFPLPWEELNKSCAGGYKRGQMTLLTGWSGMGKSIVLDQMLQAWSAQGRRCLLLTTEMQLQELVARFIAKETGVAYEKTIMRKLSAQDWKKVTPVLGKIPWHHHDADGWGVDRILGAIVNKRPDIACIDPWNLIPHKDRFSMDETARQLKTVARRANCHVVVVAHLNTARMKDGVKPRPVQRDIRDTGMLYNNAHAVLCLHRENGNGKEKRSGELFYLKSRDAPPGGIDVEFNSRYLRFDPAGTKEAAQKQLEPRPEDIF